MKEFLEQMASMMQNDIDRQINPADMLNRRPDYEAGLQNIAYSHTRFDADEFYAVIGALEHVRPNCRIGTPEFCKKGSLLFADTWAIETWMPRDDPRKPPQYLLLAHPDDLATLGLRPGEVYLSGRMIAALMKRGPNDAAGEAEGTSGPGDREPHGP